MGHNRASHLIFEHFSLTLLSEFLICSAFCNDYLQPRFFGVRRHERLDAIVNMLAGRRVLFFFDKRKSHHGGRNVSIGFINELQRMGVAAHPVYPHPKDAHYPFKKIDAEPLIYPPWYPPWRRISLLLERIWVKGINFICRFLPTRVAIPLPSCRSLIWRTINSLETRVRILRGRTAVLFSGHKPLNLRPTDIVVASDTTYSEIKELFPGNLKVLSIQDAHSLMASYAKDGRPEKVDYPFTFATSEISKAAAENIYDGEVAHIPLVVGSGDAGEFPRHKKRQIAFFPRKRRYESNILSKAIQDFLPDWRLASIGGVSDSERDAVFRESAIFLSLSYREGFGLPPAEAMRAGALVVGYTGVGGAEYMTRETCVPVLDDDIVAFVAELRKVAGSFREDGTFSEEYEKIRRNGFDTVNAKYSYENFHNPFHAFWSRVDNSLPDI